LSPLEKAHYHYCPLYDKIVIFQFLHHYKIIQYCKKLKYMEAIYQMIKRHPMTQLPHLTIFFLMILSLLLPTAASAAVQVSAEAEVSPSTITEVQNTVAAFNSVIQDTMDVTLDDEIRIVICPNRESFLEVINREVPTEKKRTQIDTVYASTYISNHAIFIDESGGLKKTANERAEIIGSYLCRHLLLQLNGQTLPNDIAVESRGVLNYLYWMNQGISDYVGALVAERQGLGSVAKWERHKLLLLRGTLTPMTQADAEVLSVTSWANFMVAAPASKADLMATYLIHSLKAKDLNAFVMYYQKSKGTTNITPVWESAFGLQYNEFIKDFVIWYNREVLLL
jgi:hypothetical protein